MRTLVVVVLLAVLAAGCGNDPEGVRADYCDKVTELQADLSDVMADDSPGTLLRALPLFRELAADAPRDIDDDWQQVLDALGGLQQALDDAGVEAGDYRADDPPASVSTSQQQAIARAAGVLARPEVAASLQSVEQQAKDVCKTPLYR